VWGFIGFSYIKALRHVAERDAFKRRATSRLLLHPRHIIAKVYINVVSINKTTLSTPPPSHDIVHQGGHPPSC
jgi:hypothetical protein